MIFHGKKKMNEKSGKVKNFIRKYCGQILLPVCYLAIYIVLFVLLERRVDVSFHTMHSVVDDFIPFCAPFVIPYLLWFIYVPLSVIYLMFLPGYQREYYRFVITLILGMSISLFIFYVFPNRQNMRPSSFARENIFTFLVGKIYASDTSTNVFPSIHVFNSLAVHIGLCKSHALDSKRALKTGSLVLCILICFATMFLKQHSFCDVIGAIVLYCLLYMIMYVVVPKINQKRHHKDAQNLHAVTS